MASSALNIIRESIRQGLTGDDKYFRKPIYFFELRVPASLRAGGTSFLFPFALNPQEITMEEPFTVEATPTQNGGLYVEENGIVQRVMRIRGHTGFKPRNLDVSFGLGWLPSPARVSYSRKIPSRAGDLSGQRHFHWLQDKVFRTYADLKQDPSKSLGTQLIFHNQKDEEHWLVVPRQFTLNRSAARPTLYEYNIELLVVDSADAAELTLSEDRGILDSIKDTLRSVNAAINLLTGAINDLTAAVAEIRSIVSAIDTIIASVGGIVSAATDFVEGVTDFINTPLDLVNRAIDAVEEVNEFLASVDELVDTAKQLPDNLRQSFRQLGDALEQLGSNPNAFQKPADRAVQDAIKRQQLSTNTSASALATAQSRAPSTLNGFRQLGTDTMPGDAARAAADTSLGTSVPQFVSVQEHKLQQGDTLQGLASRFLGDARLWKHIAFANGLKPPFVTDLEVRDLTKGKSLPGTLGRGQGILIPSFDPPASAQPNLATLGVLPEEPNDVHLLGTDFLLVSDDGGKTFDIPIDVEGGSVDAKLVSGVPNLQQAIRTRLDTEQGTDLLYRFVGMKRVIGLGSRLVDLETARFRVAEAVTLDPRVAGLRRIQFLEGNLDALVVDMDVEVRGFADPAQIQVEVR